MKYVRTKDGRIVEIPNKHKEIVYDGNVLISVEKIINGARGREIVTGFVDRKADTIEELCDKFVRVREDMYDFIVCNYIPAQREGWDIYGAILTKEGLIYVAKMNDKGEFELL